MKHPTAIILAERSSQGAQTFLTVGRVAAKLLKGFEKSSACVHSSRGFPVPRLRSSNIYALSKRHYWQDDEVQDVAISQKFVQEIRGRVTANRSNDDED